jgi:coenzyme PQQ precursor peptide PqqA
LIPGYFDALSATSRPKPTFASQQITSILGSKKISPKFSFRSNLLDTVDGNSFTRRAQMAWKAPKIVEVPVGMEINMYACAARK